MKVVQLNIYPVKSLKSISLQQGELLSTGLAWDRRWMLVDTQQRFVTQRQLPALATVEVALTTDALVFSHPSVAPISIPLEEPQGNLRIVQVWEDHCKAWPESEAVSRWLEDALGEQAKGLTLVRFAPQFKRSVEADFLEGEEAHTHFSDGYPFLVTSTGSLQALNDALEKSGSQPVPMDRFRPSIVVETNEAWAEDRWKTLQAENGGFTFTLRKPCKRCKITTVDQQTAEVREPAEPLKTLIALKTQPALKGGYFGQNATLQMGEGSTIRVGDALVAVNRES
ncbi:MOSC domain-containing protein [Vreelandella populi]|uniref:MOSC domain-containing protein n=1 Tax=Vreelandella populi TaxID=2498858 RepID=UPI000F8F2D29|nr:MOSC N-terminal beta barrel domain-containing protein [Halomonas populi]RUR53247.1 MOSC domain-containing protein [Halomonas populi]